MEGLVTRRDGLRLILVTNLDEEVGLGLREKGFRDLLETTMVKFLVEISCGGPGRSKY